MSHNNKGPLEGQLAPIGSLLEKLCKLELENDCGPGAQPGLPRCPWLAPLWARLQTCLGGMGRLLQAASSSCLHLVKPVFSA